MTTQAQDKNTEAATTPGPSSRLNTWKEIAAFFGRDVRTVQLWEKLEALPIHRHEHNARASVYAYVHELEDWLKQRGSTKTNAQILEELTANTGIHAPSVPERTLNKRPVLVGVFVLAVLAITGFAVWRIRHKQSALPERLVLAVLPFESLSGNQQDSYVVDGFTDNLITNLGRTGQLEVISRRSVMQLKGRQISPAEAAKQLHATLVLEGSAIQATGGLRITTRLIDAQRGRQIWAESYVRNTGDLLSLQDEIASDIAIGVTESLTGKAPSITFPTRPIDPGVRMAYLTGRFFWNKRDASSIWKSIEYFNEVIAKDPGYAPAYSGLADGYTLLTVWGNLTSQDAFPKAREAAQRALLLDPSSAEAYTSLAFETYRYEWDFNRADQYFRKAIQLNPNYSTAHQWYGEFLSHMRRFDQSIAESRKAVDLDPLSAIASADLANSYFHAGRYAESKAELDRILALYPDFIPAHDYLSLVLYQMGDVAGAEKEAGVYARLSGDDSVYEELHIAELASHGALREAQQRADALLRAHPDRFTNYQQATLYFNAGEKEKGYQALERAYQEHSWWLVTMLGDPAFNGVRQDPPFVAFIHRVGLNPAP